MRRDSLGRRTLVCRPSGFVLQLLLGADVVKLTPATARQAPIGTTLHDHAVRGLRLRVRTTVRSWHLYYRADGRERNPKLGTFPAMSLNRAREVARELLREVAAGNDPSATRQSRRREATVAELCDAYLAYCAQRVAPNTLQQYGWCVSDVRKAFGQSRVSEIQQQDVDRLLRRIERGAGASQCNHVRVQIRAMFNRAADTFDMLPPGHRNPVQRMGHIATERQRTRTASHDELRAIFRVLDQLPGNKAAFVAVLFTTGARISELHRARVENWQGDRFVLDDHKTFKRIGPKVVFVPPALRELVTQLVDGRPPGDRIFGHWEPKKLWLQIRKLANLPADLQMRDARRTFASYGISSESDLERVRQIFGHTDGRTTQRYAHLLPDSREQYAAGISDTILDVIREGSE